MKKLLFLMIVGSYLNAMDDKPLKPQSPGLSCNGIKRPISKVDGTFLGTYQASSRMKNRWHLFVKNRKKSFCVLTLVEYDRYQVTLREPSEQDLNYTFRAELLESAVEYVLANTTSRTRIESDPQSTEEIV